MMLLMMETYLPGPTREKIVVAYYRKSGGQSSLDSFDDIVRLCRSTGCVPVILTWPLRRKGHETPFGKP
jgi:WASH complex subunit strumpellin